MAKSFIGSTNASCPVAFGETWYKSIMGGGLLETGPGLVGYPLVIKEPGVIRNMWIFIRSNTINGASTVTSFANLTAKSQTISVGSTLTGAFENTTAEEYVALGDTLGVRIVAGGSSGTLEFQSSSFEYTTYDPSETVSRNGVNWYGGRPSAASSTTFTVLNGIANPNTPFTEADMKTRLRLPGLFRNLNVLITANARANSSTVTLRKNGADSTITVSIGAAATGQFEDVTHTETVAVDDDYCIATVLGTGVASLNITSYTISFVTQNYANIGQLIGGQADSSFAQGYTPGDVKYFGIVTADMSNYGTETDAQHIMRNINYSFSNLSIHVITNTITAATTLVFRKNAADGNQQLSIPNSTTGFFAADINSIDTTVPNDLVNYKIAVGGTGTAFQITSITENFQIPQPNFLRFF